MGWLSKLIQPVEESADVSETIDETEEEQRVDFEYDPVIDIDAAYPEDIIEAVLKEYNEFQTDGADQSANHLGPFENYMKTLPLTMADDEKVRTISAILKVGQVSAKDAKEELRCYHTVLNAYFHRLEESAHERNLTASESIAAMEKAIKNAKKEIEDRNSYLYNAKNIVHAEEDRIFKLGEFIDSVIEFEDAREESS